MTLFDLDAIEVRRNKTKDYYQQDYYVVVKANDSEDESRFVKLGDVMLQVTPESKENHVHAHPKKGIIVKAHPDSQFKEGDKIITTHSAFEDTDFRDLSIGKDSLGRDLYVVGNLEVICKYSDETEELIPRSGNLICEPIVGNLIDSPVLELSGDMVGRRRDTCRVLYSASPLYEKGDYVMVKMGGDYEFYHKGETYIKVDTKFDDDLAKVKSPNWYDSTLRRVKDLRTVKHV